MNNTVCIDENYSTTRILTKDKPVIINNPEDTFETVLFLPESEGRKGEGGLRTKGYFKRSFQDKPLITIITVVYNCFNYLEETIKSVINQTYDNIEYIIIDGGSTDGTLDIIKKYEDKIDYWVSEKDKGIYDAMNKGWNLANNYSRILYIGAGDIVISLPTMDFIKEKNNYIIYGKVKLENSIFNSRVDWFLKLGNTIHHQALLVPKNIHIKPPFILNYPTYSDYDFNLWLYNNKYKFVFSQTFVSYAMPNGISSKLKMFEMVKITTKHNGHFWGGLSLVYLFYNYLKRKMYDL